MTTPGLSSLASEDLLVSLLAPEGWDVDTDDDQLRLYGPAEAGSGYRPSFGIEAGEPDGFGDEWFDAFTKGAVERFASKPGFRLDHEERYELSSLAPLHAIWLEWDPESLGRVAQVMAFVPVSRYRLYVLDGATLAEHRDRDWPVFDAVLHSFRALPPR